MVEFCWHPEFPQKNQLKVNDASWEVRGASEVFLDDFRAFPSLLINDNERKVIPTGPEHTPNSGKMNGESS